MNLDQFDFVDIHYHANPDLYKRRHHVLQIGQQYQKLNGAVFLKSHLGSTAIQATIAQQEGLPVFPSLVLNKIAGGIHFRPIMQALAEYQPVILSKMIVHLPTMTGRAHKSNLKREIQYPFLSESLMQNETISNENGTLKLELIDILKCAKDYPIVLSTGHASKQEVYTLIEACEKWDVPHLLLNQPANPLTGFNAEELNELSKFPFVHIEQTALTYLLKYQTEDDFCEVLKRVPNVIYSSDLGQTSQMDVEEWRKESEQWFSQFNLSQQRKKEICLINPLNLLKI